MTCPRVPQLAHGRFYRLNYTWPLKYRSSSPPNIFYCAVPGGVRGHMRRQTPFSTTTHDSKLQEAELCGKKGLTIS